MSNPKFAETHNLVAFLKKPEESDGFEEIIDFLNASYVQYALTVNPTIYTTCVEQFWASAKAKIINKERQIQALVDKKKVIITETSIRSDLKLDDAEGIYCLPIATIFAELERMGYENLTQKLTFYKAYFLSQWKFLIHTILQCLSAKTIAWNEFSSTMASAIICLATNQKFNFSKYIFNNMVKHLEGGVKLVRDRDIIRDLEKQRDKLDLDVKNYKRKNEELQKTYSSLKRQMSEKEDTYHDTILDLEAKLKKNVDLFLKLGNSLQGMFMLGPKPLYVYDQQLKHGLGYPNPYTLKQAISKCPKLYVASSLGNLEIPLNVRDSEDILEDAVKSQQKMTEKMNDPIAVANKQSCWTINYKKLNALYKDFVPQKELSVEQKYFSSSSIPSVKIPVSKNMPSESPLIKELDKIKVGFEKLSLLIQQNCKRASIFYTSPAEIEINDFCQDQVKPILNELKVYLECFQNLFQRDIKEMKNVFESTESELDELEKQNELLKDQLLEASLKHDVELCVLINHECVDKILNAELEKVKKKSFEIQEDLLARIKILENDVQRCEKQSVDFQLKLQHEREKQKWDSTLKNKNTIPLDYSWISKMEKLEDENVSLDFTVQSLIKERDNAKMEYKKLF
ncbi:hypothetical protein Tco_0452254 [Tanacetum coccineum]